MPIPLGLHDGNGRNVEIDLIADPKVLGGVDLSTMYARARRSAARPRP
jgi:hypothetical protein